MEEMTSHHESSLSFGVTIGFLLLMSGLLATMSYMAGRAARTIQDAPPQKTAGDAALEPVSRPPIEPAVGSPGAGGMTAQQTRRVLARLAWLSAAMLGATLIVAFWVVARFAAHRLVPGGKRQNTPYVNAWSLAGQRARPMSEDIADSEE